MRTQLDLAISNRSIHLAYTSIIPPRSAAKRIIVKSSSRPSGAFMPSNTSSHAVEPTRFSAPPAHATAPRTLLDAINIISAMTELTPRQRADGRSALRTLGRSILGVYDRLSDRQAKDIEIAEPVTLERQLDMLSTGLANVKPHSALNTVSRARAALRWAGVAISDGRGRAALTSEWQTVLAKVAPSTARDLNVFAHYCSSRNVAPQGVDGAVIDDYEGYLTAKRPAHNARQQLLLVCRLWPLVAAQDPSVQIVAARKVRGNQYGDHYQLSLSPEFEEDLSRWFALVTSDRRGDPDRPRRVSEATAKRELDNLRRVASAFCAATATPPDQIQCIRDLLSTEVLGTVIEFHDSRRESRSLPLVRNQDYAYQLARLLAKAAHYIPNVPKDAREGLEAAAHGLAPKDHQISHRDEEVLSAFLQRQTYKTLAELPFQVFQRYDRSNRLSTTDKAQLTAACGLMLSLAMPLPPCRYVTMRISTNVRFATLQPGLPQAILFPRASCTASLVRYDLTAYEQRCLDFYLNSVRKPTATSQPDFLFPGRHGGPQTAGWFSQKIAGLTKEHLGIAINSTALRDIVAFELYRLTPNADGMVKHLLGNQVQSSSEKLKAHATAWRANQHHEVPSSANEVEDYAS